MNRLIFLSLHKGEMSEALRLMFRAADTSGDGGISQEEFDKMMSLQSVRDDFAKIGLDVEEVEQFFTVLVSDDGEADYNEFLTGALAMATSAPVIDKIKSLQHEIKIEQGIEFILDSIAPLEKFLPPMLPNK